MLYSGSRFDSSVSHMQQGCLQRVGYSTGAGAGGDDLEAGPSAVSGRRQHHATPSCMLASARPRLWWVAGISVLLLLCGVVGVHLISRRQAWPSPVPHDGLSSLITQSLPAAGAGSSIMHSQHSFTITAATAAPRARQSRSMLEVKSSPDDDDDDDDDVPPTAAPAADLLTSEQGKLMADPAVPAAATPVVSAPLAPQAAATSSAVPAASSAPSRPVSAADVSSINDAFLHRVDSALLSGELQQLQADRKYFHEVLGHYDATYFRGVVPDDDRKRVLREMLMDYTHFMRGANIQSWVMAGGLIGHYYSGDLLPWDDDLDMYVQAHDLVQLERIALSAVTSSDANTTAAASPLIPQRYVLKINPHYLIRNLQRDNSIDGRLIDTRTGLYIDIIGVVPTGALSAQSTPTSNGHASSAPALPAPAHQPVFYSSKIPQGDPVHAELYRADSLFPLQACMFAGASTWCPRDVPAVLVQKYGDRVLRQTDAAVRGYQYDSDQRSFVRPLGAPYSTGSR